MDELGQGFGREDFSFGRKEHLLQIFMADFESASADAGDDFEPFPGPSFALLAQGAEVLDTGDFVSCGSVVFGDFRFDHDRRVEFTRDDEPKKSRLPTPGKRFFLFPWSVPLRNTDQLATVPGDLVLRRRRRHLRPGLGPVAQGLDLLRHGGGQRHALCDYR